MSGTATGAAIGGEPEQSRDSGRGSSGGSGGGGGHGVLFPPGVLVGGRYLVTRFIARGGMGEVYEAEDVALRDQIALKVVRSEIASDPRASERLKRELHLARKVSHPNVCRIYDLCFHELPTTGETLPVLTMELLQGETLGARLRREAASSTTLPIAEALSIARQIAGALDAAHDQGIVHRDLKADNIFLVPGRRAGELRVVVTDFGLARGGDGPAITQGSGRMIGSPAYMAPEQVEGGAIGPAADLYAFGVVLYELTTGQRPFEGESVFEVAFKRLKGPPVSPRVHRPDLPPAWESAILKLMERKPEARFASAHEAIAAIASGKVEAPSVASPGGAPPGATPPGAARPLLTEPERVLSRHTRRRSWGAVGLVLAVIAALSTLRFGAHDKGADRKAAGKSPGATTTVAVNVDEPTDPEDKDPPEPPDPEDKVDPEDKPLPPLPPPPSRLRPSVAVLGFKNLSGRADSGWLSTAVGQMLAAELGAGEQLRVVPGETIARTKRDLTLADEESLAEDTLKLLHDKLGADFVLLGSYFAAGPGAGGKVQLNLWLQDARSGKTEVTFKASGAEMDLPELSARVGKQLRERLGVTITESEANAARKALPSDSVADRSYAEGLAHLRRWEANAARISLEKSIAADDTCPMAHAALAEALIELGYEGRAQAEARRAFELSGDLQRESKLAVEARFRSVMGERDKAIEIYRSLFNFFPDDLEHGIELAFAEWHGMQHKAALATLDQLRKLPPPASDDPRIDLLTAHVRAASGEYERARDLARVAATKARARQARAYAAEALLVEGMTEMMLGEPDAADASLKESRALYASIGDKKGVALGIDMLSGVRVWVDDIAGAIASSEEELKVARELGNHSLEWKVQNSLAIDEMLRGDLRAARKRQIERRAIEESLLKEGEKKREGYRQRFDALMYVVEGKLGAGRKAWESVRALQGESDPPSERAFVDTQLAAVLIEQDDIEEANLHLHSAEEAAGKAKDQRRVALARFYLAEAALAEGRTAEAEGHARAAADTFQHMKSPAAATAATLLAALAQARQGRVAEALAATEPQLAGLARIQPLEWRLIAQQTAARVLAMAPERRGVEAVRLASGAVGDATRAGFVGMALAAELSLGEVELQLGHAARGRAVLQELIRQSEPQGYDLISRRARELLGKGNAAETAAADTLPAATREAATIDIQGLDQLPAALHEVRRKLPEGFGKEVVRQVEEAARNGRIRALIDENKVRDEARKAREEARRQQERARKPTDPGSPPPLPPLPPPASPAPPAAPQVGTPGRTGRRVVTTPPRCRLRPAAPSPPGGSDAACPSRRRTRGR